MVAKKKLALAEPAWIQRYQKTGQRTDVIRNIHNTTRVYRRSVGTIHVSFILSYNSSNAKKAKCELHSLQ